MVFIIKDKIEINLISSIYGRPTKQLQNWINKGLLIYLNDLEKIEPALTVRQQLPSGVTGFKEEALFVRLQLPSDVTSSDKNKLLLKSYIVNKR